MVRDKKLDFRMDVDDLNDGNEPANGGELNNEGMNPDKIFKVRQPSNTKTGDMGLADNPPWGAWQENPKFSHVSNAELGLGKQDTQDERGKFELARPTAGGGKFEFEDDQMSSDDGIEGGK